MPQVLGQLQAEFEANCHQIHVGSTVNSHYYLPSYSHSPDPNV